MDLSTRYPAISFALAVTPFKHSIPQEEEKEIAAWYAQLQLDGIEILYIYGIGLGLCTRVLKPWLHADKMRVIIFLEEDLSAIAAALSGPCKEELLENPRIHIRYRPKELPWSAFLEETAFAFPADRIAVTALAGKKKKDPRKIGRIRLSLLRYSTYIQAALSEVLYAHKLFENLIPNFRRLPHSFYANRLRGCFKDVPALICGAGPSLSGAISTLKKLERRALIFAGGSAISALLSHGVEPHLALALDPNAEEFERLKAAGSIAIPLIYASRLYPTVFSLCCGPIGYLRSETGGPCEAWLEDKLLLTEPPIGPELGKEAMSVTTLAIAYAQALGCNPIILAGVDLAYTDLKRYAPGVVAEASVTPKDLRKGLRANERLVKRKGKKGESLYTLVRWVMEANSIGAYAKSHPETQFLNATEGGLPIQGVANTSLEAATAPLVRQSADLRSILYKAIADNPLPAKEDQIEQALEEIKASLKRLASICGKICLTLKKSATSGHLALLEHEVEEELAFQILFPALFPVLDQMLERIYPSCFADLSYARRTFKWEHLQTLVQSKIDTLEG